MADIQELVRLAVDSYKGNVEHYSVAESQETLRKALVEANNGSTALNYRDIRDGKCNGLFTIIEVLLSRTVIDGLQSDDFFNQFVDFRNLAEGDQNLFMIEDDVLFVVDDVADGNQAVRRQRLSGVSETSIPTSMHMTRIYEELNRVLAGRVDFNHMIDVVADSFRKKILDEIYTLWTGLTANDLGGTHFYPTAGSYDEDTLLDIISYVEAAANGKPATLVGTKKALRAIKESIMSDGAKDDFHNYGYAGKFYGTPVVAVPQRFQTGTTTFQFPDDVITVVAGSDVKIIKFVYEGDPIVLLGDPMTNMDLTQELEYAFVA